jgi:DNA-binding NarL/FixJ family response regulator
LVGTEIEHRNTLLLGRAQLMAGRPEDAIDTLHRLADAPGKWRADALLLQARCARTLGRFDEARSLMENATAVPANTRNSLAQIELATLEIQAGHVARGARRLMNIRIDDQEQEPAITVAVHALRSMGELGAGRVTTAAESFRAATHDFAAAPDSQIADVIHTVSALGWAAYFLDLCSEGIDIVERALRVGRKFGRSYALPELHTVHAYLLHKTGRLAAAHNAADDAIEMATVFGYPDIVPVAIALRLRVLIWTSSHETATAELDHLESLPPPSVLWWRTAVGSTIRDIRHHLGLPVDEPTTDKHDEDPLAPTRQAMAALAALTRGELDRARACADQAMATANRLGLLSQHGMGALASAAVDLAGSDLQHARASAEVATTYFETANMPVMAGRALLVSAAAAAAADDFDTATRHIARASALFRDTGAATLLAEAVSLQRKLAGQQTTRPKSVLTPRERQVAEMVGRGLTNKQIAADLFISPRTVEDHIGRVMRKLGAPNRTGIAHKIHNSNEHKADSS